jgi:SAM-dependent methyltransferase
MSEKHMQDKKMDIRSAVRERYSAIAENAKAGTQIDCCPPSSQSSCCGSAEIDTAQINTISNLYQDPDVNELPEEVTEISLGCGDPVTLAALTPDQTVLDLGSGGGIDCFLAAKKVGPSGRVIGVDMTAAMIEKARANKEKIGAQNVEFRLGEIEHLPVPDEFVDVIISNCVINLSPDKPQVFREAYRVMKPGGKLAVSDIVTDGPLPDVIKSSLSAWAGCIAGALDVQDYVQAIQDAGFVKIEVKPTYWEQDMIDVAIGELDLEITGKIEDAKHQEKTMLLFNDGGEKRLIEISAEDYPDFDPQKAIFSARVTAVKP